MKNLVEFAKTLGAPRIAAMGAVTFALIGFFAFLILRVTSPEMRPLFTDLTLEDSAAIVKELDRQGVQYELRGNGDVIMVPKDRVARLRMGLAQGGLPKGGGVGYEIFDKSETLGTTSFVENINAVRALEGELARTIRSLDSVEDARVHLVLPERPLFSRDKVEPSASIVVRVRGTLEPGQVRAIRHLVATAVSGLRPQRISIVDEAGNLLADGASDDPNGGDIGADERQITFERRLRQQVEDIVNSVVGPGHARVQLTADFDYNRVTQTSDKYDPDGRVVRSSQTREESSATNSGGGKEVTVGNEIPEGAAQGQTQAGAANPAPRDQTRKTEEIVNYEISKTTKTELIEGGRINRISVAVLVDGTYGKNNKGEAVYHPRTKEEIDQIAALVRSTIGFNSKRGDQVERRQPALRRAAGAAGRRTERLPIGAAFRHRRHHASHRDGGDGTAQPRRAAHGGAAAGATHPRPCGLGCGRACPAAGRRRERSIAGAAGCRCGCGRRRRLQAPTERNLEDDRHRPNPGPGARSIGAEGR